MWLCYSRYRLKLRAGLLLPYTVNKKCSSHRFVKEIKGRPERVRIYAGRIPSYLLVTPNTANLHHFKSVTDMKYSTAVLLSPHTVQKKTYACTLLILKTWWLLVQIGLELHSRSGCLWIRGCILNESLSFSRVGAKWKRKRKMRKEKERWKGRVRSICWRMSVCVCVCSRQTALWHGKCLLVLSRAELEACSKPFTFTAGLARCIEHGWHSAMFITQRHDQRALVSGCTTFIWVPTADSSIHGGLSSPLSPSLMVSLSLISPYLSLFSPLTHLSLQIRRLYLRFHSQRNFSPNQWWL